MRTGSLKTAKSRFWEKHTLTGVYYSLWGPFYYAAVTEAFLRDDLQASPVFMFRIYHYKPGGQTICGMSKLCAGFMGCADTMAGSSVWFSNSSIESWGEKIKNNKKSNPHCCGLNTWMFRVQKYLHEVVGALHLCHEVLYSLSPDQGVCLSHSSERVRFRDGRRRRLRLLLQGIYNLTRDNNQLQFQLKAALHSKWLRVLGISGYCLTGYGWWNYCSGVEYYILHRGQCWWPATHLSTHRTAEFTLCSFLCSIYSFPHEKKCLFNIHGFF